MEGNRKLVCGDIRRCDQVVANGTICTKFLIIPEPPGEIDIVSVQWLAIRPYQVRAQLDRPVLEISGDVTIGNTRNFCRQARMNHALRVAVEERGKNGLIDQDCKRFRNAVGNKRMRLLIQVVNPGASLHWRTSRGSC